MVSLTSRSRDGQGNDRQQRGAAPLLCPPEGRPGCRSSNKQDARKAPQGRREGMGCSEEKGHLGDNVYLANKLGALEQVTELLLTSIFILSSENT